MNDPPRPSSCEPLRVTNDEDEMNAKLNMKLDVNTKLKRES